METKKTTLKWVLNIAKKVKGNVILLTLLNILFALLSVVFALCCKEVIDGAENKDIDKIVFFGVAFTLIILTQFLLRIVISYVYEITKSKLLKENRQRLLKDIIDKEYQEISLLHSGEILNRIFSDVEIVAEGVSNLIPEFMNMITRLLAAIVVLFVLDYQFALLFSFAGLLLFLIAYFYRKKIKKAHRLVLESEDKVRSFYQESVENLLVVKIFANAENIYSKGEEYQNKYTKARINRRLISIYANSGFGLLFNLFYLFALVWCCIRMMNGDLSITYGSILAILQLISQVSMPVATLSSLIPQFYGVSASSERLITLENIKKEEDTKENIEDLKKIEIKNLSFGYKDNLVLKNVNVEVNKNDYVALTGISGGGKTTLFNLLLGVYKNYEGEIILKGENDCSPSKGTRNLFSYVPQGNTMFSGTIRENLTFLKDSFTDEEINNALKVSLAYDFVSSLEKGVDTLIGERGFGLSEGQIQRLTIARCILNDAPVLLLDEATSALDEETEADVLNNLKKLNKTVLIVTHRKKALSICNKQFILDDGNISTKEI